MSKPSGCKVCAGTGRFCPVEIFPYCQTTEEVRNCTFKCDTCDGRGHMGFFAGFVSLPNLIAYCNNLRPQPEGSY